MKKLMLLMVLTSVFCLVTNVYAEDATRESVIKFMKLTKADVFGEEIVAEIIPELKNVLPDAPASFWSEVDKEIDPGSLLDQVIPIYQKYLSEEDLQYINKFYASPTGQKLVDFQSFMLRESYEVAEAWGRSVVEQVMFKYQSQFGSPQ